MRPNMKLSELLLLVLPKHYKTKRVNFYQIKCFNLLPKIIQFNPIEHRV